MDWKLVAAASVFGLFMIYRFRPVFSARRGRRLGLAEALKRVDAAKTNADRATALADAGDACAASIGRTTGAVGYYLRAMRANPSSAELVERAAHGLSRRPHSLESLLWQINKSLSNQHMVIEKFQEENVSYIEAASSCGAPDIVEALAQRT